MNSLQSLKIEPVHPHIGARVEGVDLTSEIPDEVIEVIRAAFNQHSVIVLRDQFVSDEQQIAFSERFGALEEISFGSIASNALPIYHLTNLNEDGDVLAENSKQRKFMDVNARWHTDSSFKENPAKASILSGREIPKTEAAPTDFASMRVGYNTLSEQERRKLDGLTCRHHYSYSLSQLGGEASQADLDALPPVIHPLLRVHPETRTPNLYVSGHIESVVELPLEEGRALVKSLIDWCTRDEYVYSHQWREGDIVMWDNRCALHRATNLPKREVRRAHRTTLLGEGVVEAFQYA